MSAVSVVCSVTMTSLEMVELINSQRGANEAELRHDHFMAKVPKVLGEAAPKFLGTASYVNGTGAQVKRSIYRFPRREACLMAMSYSYELQAKVFDRMTELENQAAPALPDFTNPATAARAWAAEFERRQALELETTQQAKVLAVALPKAAVFDDLHHRPGCMCIRDAAKNMRVGERALIEKLIEVGWLYRRESVGGRIGGLKAGSYALDKGYFEHKPVVGRDGEMHDALLVTAKGLHRLTFHCARWGLKKPDGKQAVPVIRASKVGARNAQR